MQQAFANVVYVEVRNDRDPVRKITGPPGMVPKEEGALLIRCLDRALRRPLVSCCPKRIRRYAL